MAEGSRKRRKPSAEGGEGQKGHREHSAQGNEEHKKNYKEYMATVEDIERFLGDNLLLRKNVVTGRTECRIPERDAFAQWRADGLPRDQWLPISDRIVNDLWRTLSRVKKVKTEDIWRVIESDFVPTFNPFASYLDHLPPWDGDDYILGLSVSVTVKGEVEEQVRFARYLKKWLVGMVAAWLDGEVVNNVILVLIGEQGAYKTTWFQYLLPPELRRYFRIKTNSSQMTKDDLLSLTQYGLVCYEELDTMSQRDLNQLKSAVTMTSVDERVPYGRYPDHRPHIASFCGTGNNTQFLGDSTGNRRWLPFEVQSIDSPRDHPFDYDHIFAQAYALWQQGFQYWFSKAEIEQLAVHNRQFETPRLEAELVQMYFRVPSAQEPGEFMPVALALQLVGANITQKLSVVWLGRAFMELGFQKKTIQNVRGYLVVRRSADEMRALRNIMAQSDDGDCNTVNTVNTVIF